jgi:hypothetical protein
MCQQHLEAWLADDPTAINDTKLLHDVVEVSTTLCAVIACNVDLYSPCSGAVLCRASYARTGTPPVRIVHSRARAVQHTAC